MRTRFGELQPTILLVLLSPLLTMAPVPGGQYFGGRTLTISGLNPVGDNH